MVTTTILPHRRPLRGRLWRHPAQRADRRFGVRNAQELDDTVSGKALDRSIRGRNRCGKGHHRPTQQQDQSQPDHVPIPNGIFKT
jgi:hypothetical protein